MASERNPVGLQNRTSVNEMLRIDRIAGSNRLSSGATRNLSAKKSKAPVPAIEDAIVSDSCTMVTGFLWTRMPARSVSAALKRSTAARITAVSFFRGKNNANSDGTSVYLIDAKQERTPVAFSL